MKTALLSTKKPNLRVFGSKTYDHYGLHDFLSKVKEGLHYMHDFLSVEVNAEFSLIFTPSGIFFLFKFQNSGNGQIQLKNATSFNFL